MEIKTPAELTKAIRETENIYPGGYEFVFLASGGGELCRKCVLDNSVQIAWAVQRQVKNDSWYVYGVQSTSEMDGPVICDHCDKILLDVE